MCGENSFRKLLVGSTPTAIPNKLTNQPENYKGDYYMNTKLKNFVEIGKLVEDNNTNEIINYIQYLDSRVRDLDLQLRTIKHCCETTIQRNGE